MRLIFFPLALRAIMCAAETMNYVSAVVVGAGFARQAEVSVCIGKRILPTPPFQLWIIANRRHLPGDMTFSQEPEVLQTQSEGRKEDRWKKEVMLS